MANHRRKRPREFGARGKSSDWRYPHGMRASSWRKILQFKDKLNEFIFQPNK